MSHGSESDKIACIDHIKQESGNYGLGSAKLKSICWLYKLKFLMMDWS